MSNFFKLPLAFIKLDMIHLLYMKQNKKGKTSDGKRKSIKTKQETLNDLPETSYKLTVNIS